jgi:hypothetical protein
MATITLTASELHAIAQQVATLLTPVVPPVVTPPVVTPPVITPPAAGAFVIYQNGQFNWESDYSWNASIDYQNKAGKPGATCIAVTITAANGGFQPFAQGKKFDTTPFKYLKYSVKPTLPNQIIATGFAAINDVPDGPQGGVIVATGSGTKYAPALVAGQWTDCVVPLADFGLTNPLIQKFTIADGTGVGKNLYFVDNIELTP